MTVRKAAAADLSRIAEIFVFNNRLYYFPIFQDPDYSFGRLQVVSLIDGYFSKPEILDRLYVCDDGLIKGFLLQNPEDSREIEKLYVDPSFQGQGIGGRLIEYAVSAWNADRLWVLEKNTRAIAFYRRHGFCPTGGRKLEEGTEEYLLRMERKPGSSSAGGQGGQFEILNPKES